MCVCHESGGSLLARRVWSTAWALTPAPPATVALTIFTFGATCLRLSNSVWSAAASPPDVHQEKISTSPVIDSSTGITGDGDADGVAWANALLTCSIDANAGTLKPSAAARLTNCRRETRPAIQSAISF